MTQKVVYISSVSHDFCGVGHPLLQVVSASWTSVLQDSRPRHWKVRNRQEQPGPWWAMVGHGGPWWV